MSWAARRRFIILLIVGAVVTAFLTVVAISALYKAPSCSDGVQNQGEAGIDCGGPCAYLCREQVLSPTVLFTKTLQNAEGRVDVVSEVENKNLNAAARNVSYKISVYDSKQQLLKEISGKLDLPPGAKVPVYIPGILVSNPIVIHAFLTIDPAPLNWFSMSASDYYVPIVSTILRSGTLSAPRIEAVLLNNDTKTIDTVRVIVFVHTANGDIIDASETLVRSIPAQGSASALFTWKNAFHGVPTYIEVLPITPLP